MKTTDGQEFPPLNEAEDGMVSYLTGPLDILVADASVIVLMHLDIAYLLSLIHPEAFAKPTNYEPSASLRYWEILLQEYIFDVLDVEQMVRDTVRGVIRDWVKTGQLR